MKLSPSFILGLDLPADPYDETSSLTPNTKWPVDPSHKLDKYHIEGGKGWKKLTLPEGMTVPEGAGLWKIRQITRKLQTREIDFLVLPFFP